MINERIIQKLKQTNIAVNPEKTKVRVHKLWKSASKAQKSAVEEAAGTSRATIYRVYNTGSISAKLVVPMAQTFNVDPHFLIGKTDEENECNDSILLNFLSSLGYSKLLGTEIEKTKKPIKEKIAEKALPPVESAPPAISASELSLSDLHLLMQSLLLREKAGVEEAVQKAAKLRTLLLS